MKILIFMSSLLEMKGVLSTFNEKGFENSRLFTKNINSNTVDFYYSDPGIYSLTYFLTKKLKEEDYNLIINAGIAGSFNEGFRPGTLLRVGRDCFADIGAEERESFKDLFQMGLIDSNSFPFQNGFLFESAGSFSGIFSKLPGVNAVTVNRISSDKSYLNKLINNYNADIETMEGAAFFYTCLMEKRNCIQLRAVSNYAGERDKTKWDFQGSIKSLGEQLKIFLNENQ